MTRHYSSWYQMERALAWWHRLLDVLKCQGSCQDRLAVKWFWQAKHIQCRPVVKRDTKACIVCNWSKHSHTVIKMLDLLRWVVTKWATFKICRNWCISSYVLKQGCSEIIQYECIISCMVIRSAPLKKQDYLKKISFIMAFQCFGARRRVNFVGAEKEMRFSMRDISPDKVHVYAMKITLIGSLTPTPLLTWLGCGSAWCVWVKMSFKPCFLMFNSRMESWRHCFWLMSPF